jgi:coenzyme F420-reducing hydrogenase delta subunit
MKLTFSKNDELEVSVMQKIDNDYKAFTYVEMIKSLIEKRKLEDPEITGKFSDSEKESIASMIKRINDEVSEFYAQEAEQKN